MKNYKKHLKYAELCEKLKLALDNKFYYEAIFIEYAILEDRTTSILKYAKIDLDEKDQDLSLYNKLKKIESHHKFQNEYVQKHLPKELIKKIQKWRIKRNDLIHDLVNSSYSNNDIELLAKEGNELIKVLNNKSTLINNYNKKEKATL